MDLRLCYLFNGLTEEQLIRILLDRQRGAHGQGQLIFTGGDQALGPPHSEGWGRGAHHENRKCARNPHSHFAGIPENALAHRPSCPIIPYSLSSRCVRDGSFLFVDRSLLHRVISEDRDLGCILMTNAAGFFLDRLNQARQELRIHFATLFKSFYL